MSAVIDMVGGCAIIKVPPLGGLVLGSLRLALDSIADRIRYLYCGAFDAQQKKQDDPIM